MEKHYMNWLQRYLGLDVYIVNQIDIRLRIDEIFMRLSQIEEILKEYDFDKIPDSIEKLEDNIKHVNQMTLEMKGVISTSRASLTPLTKERKTKQPRQQ